MRPIIPGTIHNPQSAQNDQNLVQKDPAGNDTETYSGLVAKGCARMDLGRSAADQITVFVSITVRLVVVMVCKY